MKSIRLILVVCFLALCASPVLAESVWDTERDPLAALFFDGYDGYAAYDSYATSPVPFYYVDQGGCSNSQIRELQAWCSQKAGVMTVSGQGDCTSRGIHYCHAEGGSVSDYSCAISCK